MATKKITELTELSAQPASNDVVAIVDIDADVTKKITISNLQAGVQAFPFTGDAQITGSLVISGSSTPGLTIEGPIQVNHSGSPSAVFTSNSDTNEQVLIYDSKIAIEDEGSQLATLSADEYGSRNGILKLANWTSGIVGVSLTAGPYRNHLQGQLVIGKRMPADNTVHGHTLDVTGSAVITGSLEITGNVSGSATSTASFGTYLGDGSQLSNISTTPFPFTGDAQITGSLEITGSLKMIRPVNKLDLSIGSNIIIGREAGNSISDDRGAIFLGYKAGYTNTSPSSNIAIGYGAGGALGTNASQQNIFMGYLAGAGNTSIGSITSRMSQASDNIGIGGQALLYLTTGDQNIALGSTVMRNVSTGGNNIAFGAATLYNTDSGDNNIGIGYYAGKNQTSGDGNITIGSGSLGIAGESNQLRIGTIIAGRDPLIHGDFDSGSITFNVSGSDAFQVIGSEGTLFSVDDSLTGTIFSSNDVSGLPILQADSTGEVYLGKSPQSLYTTAVISATSASSTSSLVSLSTSSYDSAYFDFTCTSASNSTVGSIMSTWNGGTVSFNEYATSSIGTTYTTAGLDLQIIISQSQAQLVAITDSTSPNTWKIKTTVRAI